MKKGGWTHDKKGHFHPYKWPYWFNCHFPLYMVVYTRINIKEKRGCKQHPPPLIIHQASLCNKQWSNIKLNCHEVAEILLKVAFNIITKPPNENGTTCTCILPILNIRKLSPFHNLTIILLGIKWVIQFSDTISESHNYRYFRKIIKYWK